jgi:hypothetical protein
MRRTMFGFEGLTASGRSAAAAATGRQKESRRERERGSRREGERGRRRARRV